MARVHTTTEYRQGEQGFSLVYLAHSDAEARAIRERLLDLGAGELMIHAVGKWSTSTLGVVDISVQDRVEIDWDSLDSRKVWKRIDVRHLPGSEGAPRDWVEGRYLKEGLVPQYRIEAVLYGLPTGGKSISY